MPTYRLSFAPRLSSANSSPLDSLILAYLGSPAQFTGPRTAEFKEGLTSVLLKLREDKIRDFHIIAAEIIAYRAKFLGDDSKVLPLEGVTI